MLVDAPATKGISAAPAIHKSAVLNAKARTFSTAKA
jgi:hypothetical protein